MASRFLPCLVALLLAVPAPGAGEAPDNAATALGYVCRVLSARGEAVVAPLAGSFSVDSRLRFYDDTGQPCATGVVRSAYSDLAYVTLETGSVECLKKGFLVSSGEAEGAVRLLCQYSMNLPMVIERGTRPGHAIPKNVIVLNYSETMLAPVYFRHYEHDLGCRKCHHQDLDTPCKSCHPLKDGGRTTLPECMRKRCAGCHLSHEGKSSECVWCHRKAAPE